jgi:PAS domain S-box-containing protein
MTDDGGHEKNLESGPRASEHRSSPPGALELDWRELFDSSGEALVLLAPAGQILEANSPFCRLTGHTRDELRGLSSLQDVVAERWRGWHHTEVFGNRLVRQDDSGVYELELVTKDGSTVPVNMRTTVIRRRTGDPELLSCVVRSITQQRKIEAAYRRSEEKFRSLVETTMDWVWEVDTEARYTYVSSNVQEILGLRPEELIGTRPFDLMEPKEAERVSVLFASIANRRERVVDLEDTMVDTSGHPVVFATNAVPVFDGSGEWDGYFGTCRDITEQKIAEDALRQSEKQKSIILNSTSEMVAYYDTDLRVIWANTAAATSVGMTPQELVGRACYDIWHDRTEPCVGCPLLRALEAKVPQRGEIETPDGRSWSLRGYPILDKAGKVTGLVEFGQDVTEQKHAAAREKQLAAQLAQAQKMESVGRLAGGVAHDFNNMLSVILGHTDLLLDSLPEEGPFLNSVHEIRRSATRSADLTRQLLTFARQDSVTPVSVDLNRTIPEMLQMLQRLIGENIQLVWEPAPEVWPVKLDPSQINQILVNLCVNARDAIADSGTVTIATQNTRQEHEEPGTESSQLTGDLVCVTVEDTGSGMDEETMNHLFEPFFTTKEGDKGTGLGLATVFGIVKQNGGDIRVDSTRGVGTTFSIFLPRHAVEALEPADPDPADEAGGRHGTVLLVEDEAAILEMITVMLRRQGFTVLAAANADEAMQRAHSCGSTIDILVTDVILPGMNGLELAKELCSSVPELKVLFMSGYPSTVIARYGVLDETISFIQKPFSQLKLSQKITEILRASPE